jgi:hypothetical protein
MFWNISAVVLSERKTRSGTGALSALNEQYTAFFVQLRKDYVQEYI